MAKQEQNILKYTGTDYSTMKSQLDTLLRGDPKFANFVDSALYKIMLNIFLASTDMTNYYTERVAEESFLETAQHLSSVILGASQIGYVVRRPTPSQAEISFTIKSGAYTAGNELSIPTNTVLSNNGKKFITKYGYTYTLTAADVAKLATLDLTFDSAVPIGGTAAEPIIILNGEKVTNNIQPANQAGKKWQKYNIPDPEFSNLYSYNDLGEGEVGSTKNLTKVSIVDANTPAATGVEYHINNRSLTAEQYTVQQINNLANTGVSSDNIEVCLIKTNKDTTVDLHFGDGIATAIGPNTAQFIRVEYFKTLGLAGNETGIIGSKASIATPIAIGGFTANDKVAFYFKTNLTGGANIEDKESITLNAPQIFQALDRLVTKNDYRTYINTIVNPLPIKYTTVWGEAEEAATQKLTAVKELMNAVIISSLGSIYKETNGVFEPKKIILNDNNFLADANDINTTIIEGALNFDSFSEQAYFDLYIKNSALDYLNNIWSSTSEISSVKAFLKQIVNRSQVTLKSYYLPPIIQSFNIIGNVKVNSFSDIAITESRVKSEIFRLINISTKFGEPINLSDLYDIVTSFGEVDNCTLAFKPNATSPATQMVSVESSFALNEGDYTTAVADIIKARCTVILQEYLKYDINDTSDPDDVDTDKTSRSKLTTIKPPALTSDYITSLIDIRNIEGMSEREFYDDFAKKLYNDADLSASAIININNVPYIDSSDFKFFVSKVNSMMKETIRNSMLDIDGNIVNYSFPNEIVQLKSALTFTY